MAMGKDSLTSRWIVLILMTGSKLVNDPELICLFNNLGAKAAVAEVEAPGCSTAARVTIEEGSHFRIGVWQDKDYF